MKTIKGIWLHIMQLTVLILITATTASAQLHAGFSASQTSGCPPMVVSFQDTSAGKPVLYKWDLGNGTTATIQNPITTYFNPGTYNVRLIVTNANGIDSVVKNRYIVVNSLPVSKFSATDSVGCFPLNVQFNDSSLAVSGTISKWQWDFGDGTLSTSQSPSHKYTSPGSFTVILKVSNSNGCNAVYTKPAYINIHDGVKADFSYNYMPGCTTPATVTFTNQTAGTGIINYMWDFGDGQKSTQTNPANNYNTGIYTVKLKATSSFGCTDSIVKTNAVNIGSIHADFTVTDSVCLGNNSQFTNTSTPANFTSVQWSFDDGTSSTQTNPGKIYSTPGTYKVKLVTVFGTCSDSITKSVTVLPSPTAAFTAANTSGCMGPLSVTFNNTSANAVSYLWSFGDGSTSTLQNPVHAYTSFGTYSVSLNVKNAFGCTVSVTKDNLIKFAPLKIQSVNNLGIKGCLPLTASPTATIEDNLAIATYLWDFGDGTTSTVATPSHTYTKPGSYDVKLIVTTAAGCTDTMLVKDAVKAGNKPAVQFTATPLDVCAAKPVNFNDLTGSNTTDEWLWFFGDGGSSAVQNPIYTYQDTGYFNVTLIASSFGCSDTLTINKFIHVRPPVAAFDTSFFCSDPLKRMFLNKSLGANTYSWDFGDGATSALQNPLHTYAGPGNYDVLLTVSNGQCVNVAKKNVVVIKEHGLLSISDSVSCLNSRVTFNVKNINESNINTYSWYFDGIPGNVIVTGNNPVAWSFSETGQRKSAVILNDILNCNDTLYATVPLAVYGPQAFFRSVAPNTCYGNTVNFIDSTITDGVHSITRYVWNFGEGTPQSYPAGPFSHNYSALGTYDVKLVVTDSYGCTDSITNPSFVSITKPVASFTPSDTALCPSVPITFTNKSNGVNATYKWNFGDGVTSADVSPVHAFAKAGSYKVVMVMVDKNGCTAADSVTINIYSAKADFAMSDSFSTCPPLVVTITNQSANYIDLNWDFGDGGNSQLTDPSHIYTYPGNYTVKLSIKNNGGCTDVLTKKVVIQGPTGTFDYVPKEACIPGTLNYKISAQKTVSYVWDFNDGNTIFTVAPTASHTYSNAGIYLPKVILQDAFGCKVPVLGLDTVKIHSINTNILSDTKVLCDSGFVSFADSTRSDDALGGFLWNFGDGTTSTTRKPSHHYADTGYYTVKLISTTAFGCQDSATTRNYIKVISSPAITMLGDSAACEPAKIQLMGNFVRKDTSAVTWVWNFGNGATSGKQVPDSQTYAHSGSYVVTAQATNGSGCSNMVSKTVVVHPKPDVDAGVDAVVCKTRSYTLNASGATSYVWTANSSLSCTNCATPVVRPDSSVTYHVMGKSAFGCTNADSVNITVQQPFKMMVSKADTLCKGEAVSLKASGTDVYKWTPSLWLDNSTSATPKAKPDTTTTYQVIGSDINGCFKDTQNVQVKVYPIPTINITNGSNIGLQVGGNIKLATKSSADITSWKWFPSQWLSCASCAEPVAAPKDNITYSVTASNDGKCTAHDQITINLICGNANVFIPNTFSPNNDGSNDVLYPRGTGLFNILTFKVFNRWGQVVFQKNGIAANNPQDGWDGTLNGLPLQPDVYVYLLEVVCVNNQVFPFKGNVSLIR